MITITKRKIYFIIGYLFILTVIWFLIGKKKSSEGFGDSNQTFGGGNSTEIIKTFGTILRDKPEVAAKALLFKSIRPKIKRKLPKAFPGNDINGPSWKKYSDYLSPIGNQEQCGSCWAWSTSGILADRFSLLSGGKIKVQMSPTKLVICAVKFNDQEEQEFEKNWDDLAQRKEIINKFLVKPKAFCDGNDLYSAMHELYAFGTTSMKCVPYNTLEDPEAAVKYNMGKPSEANNLPNCLDVISEDFDTCVDHKTAARIYRADDIYALTTNENDIMQEIYRYGPVSAGFKVYEGFLNDYDGKTVYTGPKKNENAAGGHAIRIVGWGEEGGVPFWWIANSWSVRWGMRGYFRMKRMITECQLEQNVLGLKPEFPGKSVWDASNDIIDGTDKHLRDFFKSRLNVDSLYYNTAMEKIKAGKLSGDIKPIITRAELPNKGDFDRFWIADLIGSDEVLSAGSFFSSGTSSHSVILNIIFIIFAIVGVCIILKFV